MRSAEVSELYEQFRPRVAHVDRPAAFFQRFFFAKPSRRVAITASIGLLLFVGYMDWVTGPETEFSLFYAIPVCVAAWFVGRGAGLFLSLASAGVWLIADVYGGGPPIRQSILCFNTANRVFCFIAIALLLAELKALSAHLGAMVEERTRALRKLASELSDAENLERKRLAHDIHDGFSQMLSVLKLSLATSLSANEKDSPHWTRINDAIGTVNELIQRSRTLTFDLYPAMLDHLGLTPTVRHHAEQFARQANLEVLVNESGGMRALTAPVANYLFRAIKELMNNAAKHGNARQIIVSLHWTPSLLRVLVDDDGRGFDASGALAPGPARGLGLAGIHERLLSLAGSVRIESNAGMGTRVVLEVPIDHVEKTS